MPLSISLLQRVASMAIVAMAAPKLATIGGRKSDIALLQYFLIPEICFFKRRGCPFRIKHGGTMLGLPRCLRFVKKVLIKNGGAAKATPPLNTCWLVGQVLDEALLW